MQEEWKLIEEYPNYMISNLGRLKSLSFHRTGKEQILKQNINGRGYNYKNISYKGKYKNLFIHREVAKAFIPNNNRENTDVNHKDGNKQNNRVDNLEWCTRSENILHAYKHNLKKKPVGYTYRKRCELAIEYIKEKTTDDEGNDLGYSDNIDYEILLNILNGDSDENIRY